MSDFNPHKAMTGAEYRADRKALGLTAKQLAERLNVSLRTIERIESEGCSVTMSLAMRALKAEKKS